MQMRPVMLGHEKLVCSCGSVIAQCKCIAGHGNVRIVDGGCDKCKKKAK